MTVYSITQRSTNCLVRMVAVGKQEVSVIQIIGSAFIYVSRRAICAASVTRFQRDGAAWNEDMDPTAHTRDQWHRFSGDFWVVIPSICSRDQLDIV